MRINLDECEKDSAFDEIYRQFYQVVKRYCSRKVGSDMAEDITIDVFVLLYKKWDTLFSHQNNLIYSWLCSAVDNKCKEYYREKIRKADIISIDHIIECCKDESIDGTEENIKYSEYINQIRKRLPSKDLAVFDSIVVKERSYAETAKQLNMTEVYVRVKMTRIRKKIKMFIGDVLGSSPNVNKL